MKSIFVQIASYRDPQLVPTIRDLISNAKHPENLKICIAHQHDVKKDGWDNLNEFKNDYVRNFSSGMVRRAELLIAELKSPDLLCIDEPNLFLDSNGLDLLSNLLRRRTNSKKTNILSSQMNTDLFDEVNLEVNLNVK